MQKSEGLKPYNWPDHVSRTLIPGGSGFRV